MFEEVWDLTYCIVLVFHVYYNRSVNSLTGEQSMIEYKFLRSHALFGGLTEDEIKTIRTLLKEEHYVKGKLVVEEGGKGDRIYFIYEGSVEVLKKVAFSKNSSSNTKLKRIAILGVGDTFGEMELIDIQPCIATIRALEDTSVLTLSNMDLYRISKTNLKTYTLIIMNLAREISRRLRRMDGLVAGSLFSDQEKSE